MTIGRRGQLNDSAIAKYFINGLDDYNLRKTISVMNFSKYSELLKSLQSAIVNSKVQPSFANTKQNIHFKRSNEQKPIV